MHYKLFLYIWVCFISLLVSCNSNNNNELNIEKDNNICLDLQIDNFSSNEGLESRAVSSITWEYKINNMIFIYYEGTNYKGSCFFTETNLPVNSNGSASITVADYISSIQIGTANKLYIICNFTDQTDQTGALSQLFGSNNTSDYSIANLTTKLNDMLPTNETGLYESSDFPYGVPMYGLIDGLKKYNVCDVKRSIARLQFNTSFVGKTITLQTEHFNKSMSFFNNGFSEATSTTLTAGNVYYIIPSQAALSATKFDASRPCIMMSVKPGVSSATEYYRIDFWKQSSKEYLDVKNNYYYTFNINSLNIRGYASYDEALSNPGSNINLKDEFTDCQFYNGQYYVKLVYQNTATSPYFRYNSLQYTTYKYFTGNYIDLIGSSYQTKNRWYNNYSGNYNYQYLGIGIEKEEGSGNNVIRSYLTGLYLETNIPQSSLSLSNFENRHNYEATKNGILANNGTNYFSNIVNCQNLDEDRVEQYFRYFVDNKIQIGDITLYPIYLIEKRYNYLTSANYGFTGDMNFTLGNFDFTITFTFPR